MKKKGFVMIHDFTTGPMDVGPVEWIGPIDLIWSVEFLEHVEERYIPNFMPLFTMARRAVVTAAPPGKKGHHHVNCNHQSYWVDIFEDYGLELNKDETKRMRAGTKMDREFMRETGMVFNQKKVGK